MLYLLTGLAVMGGAFLWMNYKKKRGVSYQDEEVKRLVGETNRLLKEEKRVLGSKMDIMK
jgi:hypothetical protein